MPVKFPQQKMNWIKARQTRLKLKWREDSYTPFITNICDNLEDGS